MKTAESKNLNEDGTNYSSDGYAKACNTVDVCVCRIANSSLEVLMIKRAYPPFRDHWAIPGGFIDIDNNEGIEEAAIRELKEETGISGLPVFQLRTYGDPDRDPRDRMITTVYYSIPPKSVSDLINVNPEDDEVKEYKWVDIRNLPENIAFDHARILKDLDDEIISSVDKYAFDFIDSEFTFKEIQDVFEIILKTKLDCANFRRKLITMFNLVRTSRYKKMPGPGRASEILICRGKRSF